MTPCHLRNLKMCAQKTVMYITQHMLYSLEMQLSGDALAYWAQSPSFLPQYWKAGSKHMKPKERTLSLFQCSSW